MAPRVTRASSTSNIPARHQPSSRRSKPPPSPSTATRKPARSSRPTKRVKGVSGQRREEEEESELSDLSEEEEGEEVEEEASTSTGAKKRKAAPTPIASKTPAKRVIQPKPRRSDLNPLPRLFDPHPSHSSFSFPIPSLPSPSSAPRAVFICGTGENGLLGLGAEEMEPIKRPRRHVGFQEKIDSAEEGWKGGTADIVAGGMHSLVVDSEGRVWSWGNNDNVALGRLTSKPGIDSDELESKPMLVEELDQPHKPFKAVEVSAGDGHSVTISEDGRLRAWGSYRSKEGETRFDATNETQLQPTEFDELAGYAISQVVSGANHFVAVTTTGILLAWGLNEQCQLGREKILERRQIQTLPLKTIVLVASGSSHSFAVRKDGEVYGCGANSCHQLGVVSKVVVNPNGTKKIREKTPTLIPSLSPKNHHGARVVQIAAGQDRSLFLFDNGKVYGCGCFDEYLLGNEHEGSQALQAARAQRFQRQKELTAKVDEDYAHVSPTDLAGAAARQAAISAASSQAAQDVPLPPNSTHRLVPLVFPNEPKTNSPAVTALRTVDDFPPSGLETEPTQIIHVAAGARSNFAVSARGYVYSWGVGTTYQLGQGPGSGGIEVENPRRVWCAALKEVRVLKAVTGGQHSVLLGVDRGKEEEGEEKEKEGVKDEGKEEEKGEEAIDDVPPPSVEADEDMKDREGAVEPGSSR